MDEDIKPNEWINARESRYPRLKPSGPPKIDPIVSQLVGKPILVNDSRLIKLFAKWERTIDPNSMDDPGFLKTPSKIKELRETFK